MSAYENMIESLKLLKEKESAYKEAVDNANSFLHGEFRDTVSKLTEMLLPQPLKVESMIKQVSTNSGGPPKEEDIVDLGIEGNRCEAVHEAINKFVVYEKFSEMTHKYDVQNFSKLLEDYNTADELRVIRSHLQIDPQIVSDGDTPVDDGVATQENEHDDGNIPDTPTSVNKHRAPSTSVNQQPDLV